MKKKSYKRKRGPVQSKKITYDGITFASGLERYMYTALKKSKIKALYEGQTFELVEGFDFPFEAYLPLYQKGLVQIQKIQSYFLFFHL